MQRTRAINKFLQAVYPMILIVIFASWLEELHTFSPVICLLFWAMNITSPESLLTVFAYSCFILFQGGLLFFKSIYSTNIHWISTVCRCGGHSAQVHKEMHHHMDQPFQSRGEHNTGNRWLIDCWTGWWMQKLKAMWGLELAQWDKLSTSAWGGGCLREIPGDGEKDISVTNGHRH